MCQTYCHYFTNRLIKIILGNMCFSMCNSKKRNHIWYHSGMQRKAVLRTTCGEKAKHYYLTAYQIPILQPSVTILGNINYVVENYNCAKLHCNPLINDAPNVHFHCMCRFIYMLIFLVRVHSPNIAADLTYYSSNDAKRKLTRTFLSGGQIDNNLLFGVCSPKIHKYLCLSRKISAKAKLPNNVLLIRNTSNVVMYQCVIENQSRCLKMKVYFSLRHHVAKLCEVCDQLTPQLFVLNFRKT